MGSADRTGAAQVTWTQSFASTPTSGNLLVVCSSHGGGTPAISGAGWTQFATYTTVGTLWWKIAGAAEPTIISITNPGGVAQQNVVMGAEYSGVDATTPLDTNAYSVAGIDTVAGKRPAEKGAALVAFAPFWSASVAGTTAAMLATMAASTVYVQYLAQVQMHASNQGGIGNPGAGNTMADYCPGDLVFQDIPLATLGSGTAMFCIYMRPGTTSAVDATLHTTGLTPTATYVGNNTASSVGAAGLVVARGASWAVGRKMIAVVICRSVSVAGTAVGANPQSWAGVNSGSWVSSYFDTVQSQFYTTIWEKYGQTNDPPGGAGGSWTISCTNSHSASGNVHGVAIFHMDNMALTTDFIGDTPWHSLNITPKNTTETHYWASKYFDPTINDGVVFYTYNSLSGMNTLQAVPGVAATAKLSMNTATGDYVIHMYTFKRSGGEYAHMTWTRTFAAVLGNGAYASQQPYGADVHAFIFRSTADGSDHWSWSEGSDAMDSWGPMI